VIEGIFKDTVEIIYHVYERKIGRGIKWIWYRYRDE
jgi:hypothetical protein